MIKTRFLAFLTILCLLPLMSCEDLFFAEKIIKIAIAPDYDWDGSEWGKVDLAYYNTEEGVDWEDKESYDFDYSSIVYGVPVRDEEVYHVEFRQYSDQYTTSFNDPVTFVLYKINQFNNDIDEEDIIASKTVEDLKGEYYYEWNPAKNTFEEIGTFEEIENPEDDDSDPSNPITGRWNLVGGCSNLNGDTDYLVFNSGGSGRYFKSDCNNLCENYGYTANFNYTISGTILSIDYYGSPTYCGITENPPSDQSATFNVSGNILTIDGAQFQRN